MTEQVGARIPRQMLEALDRAVREGGYQDRSSFIREAIAEKLDPDYGKAQFIKMLRKALRDPEVRKELQKAM